MIVCLFGNYIIDYPRVATLRKGLRLNGVKIIECHTRQRGIKKYLELYKQHTAIKNKYDVLIVGMGGQTLVWFAKLLTFRLRSRRKRKIIFDAFASLYLTNVADRKTCSSKSLRAVYYKFLDKISCKLADKVLLDTQAQINFFVKKFKLPASKFIQIFTSADDEIYFPQNKSKHLNKFIIHWHGHIVPFHSLETIIHATKLLEKHPDIQFQIVTRFTSKYQKAKALAESLHLQNVRFYSETDYSGVAEFINAADVCLGVFGNNQKAQVVIPNKIIEAIACAKPVITTRHKVIFELFTENKNILSVPAEDSQELASQILELKNNSELRNKIGKNVYQLYLKKLKPEILYKKLKDILLKLCQRQSLK